jgi:hypothetical protein
VSKLIRFDPDFEAKVSGLALLSQILKVGMVSSYLSLATFYLAGGYGFAWLILVVVVFRSPARSRHMVRLRLCSEGNSCAFLLAAANSTSAARGVLASAAGMPILFSTFPQLMLGLGLGQRQRKL